MCPEARPAEGRPGRRFELCSRSPEETRRLGRAIGEVAQEGWVFLLNGPLGAGKTVLAQGILAGLGVSGRMPSPSFTVIREYKGRHDAWHIDLFRLDGDDDFLALGGDEILLGGRGVAVVEWAERLRGLVPERSVLVRLDVAPEGDGHEVRRLTFDLRGRGFGALDGVLGCWPGQRGGAGRGGGNP